MGGGHIFVLLILRFMQFQENFFSKNRQTLFGALKYRQTLFNAQILFYKDFYDFTHQSPVVNGFPSFAMDLREANWRPTYLVKSLFAFRSIYFLRCRLGVCWAMGGVLLALTAWGV